jgi:hypothetical protein
MSGGVGGEKPRGSPLSRLRSKSWEPRKQAEIENAIAAYEKRAEEARHDLAARVRFR